MTEAEFQRLAEIITGLASDPAPPAFSYLELLGTVIATVVAGVIVNQITAHLLSRSQRQADRRAKLQQGRVMLYGALREYRRLKADMAAVSSRDAEAQFDVEANRAYERHAQTILQRILEAVNIGDDIEFGRLIRDKLQISFNADPGSAQALVSEVKRIDEIIAALEPEVLPLSERLIDEFRTEVHERTERQARQNRRR